MPLSMQNSANPLMPTLLPFGQKLFRSFAVITVTTLIVASPMVFPSARPFYTSLHDNLWLTAVGYLWTRFLPFSAFFGLAGGILALGGWLAWLFGKRPVASLQGRLAHHYIRLQPSLKLYRAGAATGVRLCLLKNRLPERWRTRFPVRSLPDRYGSSLPDALVVRMADRVWNDWAIQCWKASDAEWKRKTALRLVTLSRGLAALFAPGDKYIAVLHPANEPFALAYLDNATPYERESLVERETLFRRLLSLRSLDPDNLTAFSVYEALSHPQTEDRMTLLRALIGLWEETRQPDVAATVVQQFSRHLDEIANTFEYYLRPDTEQMAVTTIWIPSTPIRLFAVRYLAFLSDAYGSAATICASNHLSRLAQLAQRVLARPSPAETPEETASTLFIRALADQFVEADTVMDAYRKAFAWQTRAEHLDLYQETAQRALLSAAYSTGDPDMLRTVLQPDSTIEPREAV